MVCAMQFIYFLATLTFVMQFLTFMFTLNRELSKEYLEIYEKVQYKQSLEPVDVLMIREFIYNLHLAHKYGRVIIAYESRWKPRITDLDNMIKQFQPKL